MCKIKQIAEAKTIKIEHLLIENQLTAQDYLTRIAQANESIKFNHRQITEASSALQLLLGDEGNEKEKAEVVPDQTVCETCGRCFYAESKAGSPGTGTFYACRERGD